MRRHYLLFCLFLLQIGATKAVNILPYTQNLNYENSADSFPYVTYLRARGPIRGADILEERQLLDSLKLNSRRIIFNLYGPRLLQFEHTPQDDFTPEYLKEKINTGQVFMAFADMDKADPNLFLALGSFWLQYVNHIIADTVAATPGLAYRKDFNYVIERLGENKFAPTLPAESNAEKVITTIGETEWGHLLERFITRTSLAIKGIFLLLALLLCMGVLSTFKIFFSHLKKLKA